MPFVIKSKLFIIPYLDTLDSSFQGAGRAISTVSLSLKFSHCITQKLSTNCFFTENLIKRINRGMK